MEDDKFDKFVTWSSWLLYIMCMGIFAWHILSGRLSDQYWYVFIEIAILWGGILIVLAQFSDEQ